MVALPDFWTPLEAFDMVAVECPSAGSPLGGSLILVDGDRAR